MSLSLLFPSLVAVLAGLGAGFMQARLRSSTAVRAMTLLAVVAALGVAWALFLIAGGFLLQIPWLAERAGWCRRVLDAHDTVSPLAGVGALVVLAAMAAAVTRFERRWQATLRRCGDGEGLEVLDVETPLAYAVPGEPGRVVVSTGMLGALDAQERRALLAHEWSHLDHGHHRYLRIAGWAGAAVPVLRPLEAQLRYATERWADEDAVVAVGDRRVVARAIARAALAGSPVPAPGVLAMAGIGVTARVEALVSEAPASRLTAVAPLAGATATIASLSGSTVQLHHLFAFGAHVCGLT